MVELTKGHVMGWFWMVHKQVIELILNKSIDSYVHPALMYSGLFPSKLICIFMWLGDLFA